MSGGDAIALYTVDWKSRCSLSKVYSVEERGGLHVEEACFPWSACCSMVLVLVLVYCCGSVRSAFFRACHVRTWMVV